MMSASGAAALRQGMLLKATLDSRGLANLEAVEERWVRAIQADALEAAAALCETFVVTVKASNVEGAIPVPEVGAGFAKAIRKLKEQA